MWGKKINRGHLSISSKPILGVSQQLCLMLNLKYSDHYQGTFVHSLILSFILFGYYNHCNKSELQLFLLLSHPSDTIKQNIPNFPFFLCNIQLHSPAH